MTQRTITPTLLPARSGQRLLWPLVLAASLSACASLRPDPADPAFQPAPAPLQWTQGQAREGQAATDLGQWWAQLGDAQLTALIEQALRANTSVLSAQAALRQARAQADVQQAGTGPSLSASGSAQRSQSGNASPGNRFQAGFDARWEPDIFGGNRAAADASETDAQASAASLANVRVSLAAEVAANYINLGSLQTRQAIAQNNLSSQLETLQIARWRAQAGLASSLDVEQAVSAAEQTRAQLPSLQTNTVQTWHALAVLTGQAPGALPAALLAAAPLPAAPAALALSFPADTLRQRPDVRAAELRVRSALDRVTVANAARYPSFNLSGSLGLSALTLGTLSNGASLAKALLASVSVPLFDSGARDAQVRAQLAALDQAAAAHQSAVLNALKDVEDALVGLKGDGERLARLQAAATAAVNAELLARQRYQSGLIDFATLLTTQRTLLSLQDSVASAQANVLTDHVQLYKALGGGWTPDAPGAAPAAAAQR